MKTIRVCLLSLAVTLFVPWTVLAQDSVQLVDVVATGYGTTPREATKVALRAAVEQVVGEIVDAKSRIENEQLIEDEILTCSTGMIESAKQIGEPKKSASGIYSVMIKATVKKGKVKEKLRPISPVNVTVDGDDLFARMLSAQDNLNDAEAMIKNVLDKHTACVVAEAVPGQHSSSPLDLDPKTGEVFANVHVHIDVANYRKFVEEIVEKLGPLAKSQARLRSQDYQGDGKGKFSAPTFQNSLIVMDNYRTGTAIVLYFDENRIDVIGKCSEGYALAFMVVLLDKSGIEMGEKTVSLGGNWRHGSASIVYPMMKIRDASKNMVLIMPMFEDRPAHNNSWGSEGETLNTGWDSDRYTEKTFRISLGSFSPDELKTAGRLEIKIGHLVDDLFVE